MVNEKLSDLNIIITDKAMNDIYHPGVLDSLNRKIIREKNINDLNLYTTPEQVLKLSNKLGDYFYLIAGSSNFHHLDVANLSRLRYLQGESIQLLLFDQHMDCTTYVKESNILHCGNWVSYAYRTGLICRVAMIGVRDFRKIKGFDTSLEKNADLFYFPDVDKPINTQLLNFDTPTYISIDTDIINEANDWEKGRHSLQSIIGSPIWEQLSQFNLIGASILGHVTDNRKVWDLIKRNYRKQEKSETKFSLSKSWGYLTDTFLPKLWISIVNRPLSLDKQFEIIQIFYNKIQSIRNWY